MTNFEKARAARLQSILNKKFRFRGIVYTWMTLADSGLIVAKRTFVEEYASRKINLEYAKLKTPKTTYCLGLADGSFIDCPKTVFDWFPVAAYA